MLTLSEFIAVSKHNSTPFNLSSGWCPHVDAKSHVLRSDAAARFDEMRL